MPERKRRQKVLRISNFVFLLVVFNDITAVKRLSLQQQWITSDGTGEQDASKVREARAQSPVESLLSQLEL